MILGAIHFSSCLKRWIDFDPDPDETYKLTNAAFTDMFLLKPLSIRELLAHCPWVAIDSEFGDKHYPWVPFVAMDFKKLPDIREIQFHVDVIDGVLCDSGSHAYHYLQEHPEISYQLYPRCPGECGVEFYMGGQWVHHLGGSSLIPNEQKEGFIRSLLPF
jgi:hypothetical protein